MEKSSHSILEHYRTTDLTLREIYMSMNHPLSLIAQETSKLLNSPYQPHNVNHKDFMSAENRVLQCQQRNINEEELFVFLVVYGFHCVSRRLVINANLVFKKLLEFNYKNNEAATFLLNFFEAAFRGQLQHRYLDQERIYKEMYLTIDRESHLFPMVVDAYLKNIVNRYDPIAFYQVMKDLENYENNHQIKFIKEFFQFFWDCKNISVSNVAEKVKCIEKEISKIRKIAKCNFTSQLLMALHWLNMFQKVDEEIMKRYPFDHGSNPAKGIVTDLYNHSPHNAWKKAKKYLSEDFYLTEYSYIRSAISSKKVLTAKNILQHRIEMRGSSYVDDFFLSRIYYLEGKINLARNYLEKSFEFAKKNNCLGHLKCELRLSCELSPLDVYELMRVEKTVNKVKQRVVFSEMKKKLPEHVLIGSRDWHDKVMNDIAIYANLNQTVLIRGETGTGKEIVARLLHQNGNRRDNPFYSINCGGISKTLLESELFGHVKGAFTGANIERSGLVETARDGILFLDEIGDLPLELQVSLLRVIENNEFKPVGSNKFKRVNCRIVCASNINFEKHIEKGTFRKDLYYRITGMQITLPPLRERRFDIPLLAQYFLKSDLAHIDNLKLSKRLEQYLYAYDWPGNVRELKNEIDYMKLLNRDTFNYDLKDLRKEFFKKLSTHIQGDSFNKNTISGELNQLDNFVHDIKGLKNGKMRLSRLERRGLIEKMFREHKNLTRLNVCQVLGVSPMTITNDFKQMEQEGLIKKICPTRSSKSHYFVLNETTEIRS